MNLGDYFEAHLTIEPGSKCPGVLHVTERDLEIGMVVVDCDGPDCCYSTTVRTRERGPVPSSYTAEF